ncbi:MAG: hypothetical protein WBO73_16240 [Gammaproteobacteria bacterium]
MNKDFRQLNNSPKQFAVLMAGLLLIAGQLASIVHAADHPFHADEEICAFFASLEHNDIDHAVSPQGNHSLLFINEFNARLTGITLARASRSHLPRAPPLHT